MHRDGLLYKWHPISFTPIPFLHAAGSCDGLNRNGPHKLIYLNVWPLGRSATWQGLGRVVFFGVGVALLRKVSLGEGVVQNLEPGTGILL